jgi:hypothetical protein
MRWHVVTSTKQTSRAELIAGIVRQNAVRPMKENPGVFTQVQNALFNRQGDKMKKLLSIAALFLTFLAFSPFAQAQGYPGHPDARNDRRMEVEREHRAVVARRHHMRHMTHRRIVRHH